MVARGRTLSAEQKQKMNDGRVAAKKAARIIGFPVDCEVRVDTPGEPRYHGKTGTVTEHNLGEIGVRFGSSAAVWFLPNMLIRVANGQRHMNGGQE